MHRLALRWQAIGFPKLFFVINPVNIHRSRNRRKRSETGDRTGFVGVKLVLVFHDWLWMVFLRAEWPIALTRLLVFPGDHAADGLFIISFFHTASEVAKVT